MKKHITCIIDASDTYDLISGMSNHLHKKKSQAYFDLNFLYTFEYVHRDILFDEFFFILPLPIVLTDAVLKLAFHKVGP